jgi:hypothetical protein
MQATKQLMNQPTNQPTNQTNKQLPNQLTNNSMGRSPYRETDRPSASQNIPHILYDPEACYGIQSRPPLAPILSQINSVLTSQTHFLQIHFNIILPSLHIPLKAKINLNYC